MARVKKNTKKPKQTIHSNGKTIGYEAKLWQMADALHHSMDAAEYKHVIQNIILSASPASSKSNKPEVKQ